MRTNPKHTIVQARKNGNSKIERAAKRQLDLDRKANERKNKRRG